MNKIKNPILPGFNPDPSIIRVGDDYYIATSTFEWFPGVQIHHSKDLKNWRLAARPLNTLSKLDMRGDAISGGIFAPCLSYDKGIFYLVYTDVKDWQNPFMNMHNYLVTSTSIEGEWSEPVYLNSTGFDPSLFHDNDGRKWLVNMFIDYRKKVKSFAGILLQEYSEKEKKLIGPAVNIFEGTDLDWTEGPHLYKKGGYYYLIVAEGGTSYGHAVTMARSENIWGPYELHPDNPVLTSRDDESIELQKAGHADIIETQNGEWYMVHLCGRPITPERRCVLGRETAIQKVEWKEDGWLYLANGTNKPDIETEAPNLPEHPWDKKTARDDFDLDKLDINFHTLRVPLGEDTMSLTARPGYLRLIGKESLGSKCLQSLVARRQQAFCYTAETCVEFKPESFRHMAGLVCMYDTENYYYLRISYDEKLGKCLGIVAVDNNVLDYSPDNEVSIEGCDRCYLRVQVDYEKLQFFYSRDGKEWAKIGPVLDASRLSDDYCKNGSFTGAFIGLCCQDMVGRIKYADFDYFEYIERG